MSISYIVGIIVGIVIVLFCFIFTKILLKKKGLLKKECYDERQEIEKGKGYKMKQKIYINIYPKLLLLIMQYN